MIMQLMITYKRCDLQDKEDLGHSIIHLHLVEFLSIEIQEIMLVDRPVEIINCKIKMNRTETMYFVWHFGLVGFCSFDKIRKEKPKGKKGGN